MGLLFDKTAGSGSTDRIHDGKGHMVVFQGGGFGILPPNLDDDIHIRVHRQPGHGP